MTVLSNLNPGFCLSLRRYSTVEAAEAEAEAARAETARHEAKEATLLLEVAALREAQGATQEKQMEQIMEATREAEATRRELAACEARVGEVRRCRLTYQVDPGLKATGFKV